MRVLLKSWVVICLLCAATTNLFAAEPPAGLEPLPEPLPPPNVVEDDNSVLEPEVTIVKKGKETIEEYRINGELYMMKVTPANGKPYYMHKDDQNGGWINDGPSQPLSIPKWVIFKF